MLAYIATLVTILPVLAIASPINGEVSLTKRATYQQIHLGNDRSKCLSVKKGPYNGSPVSYSSCSDTSYLNNWDISMGNNNNGVVLSGTGFCLDATTGSQNNTPLKVWQCYPGLFQQTWYYTGDLHIAITGGSQCMDNGPSGPQTYQCVGGNTNQIWTVGAGMAPVTTTAPVSTMKVSSTASAPMSTTTGSSSGAQRGQFKFSGSSNGCLSVGPYPQSGSQAFIATCASPGSSDINPQYFNINRNTPHIINLVAYPNLCLDAGVNPNSNGSPITVYQCTDGYAQQNWYYTNDNHLALTGLTTCLDVVKGSGPTSGSPAGYLQSLQTYQCSSDPQQVFTAILAGV